MSKEIKIDWFFTPLFLLMIAVSSCSVAEDIETMKNHLIGTKISGDNNAGTED